MKYQLLLFALLLTGRTEAQVINSTWLSDGTGNFNNGNWSNALLWNPAQVPTNNGGTVFDVTIPFYPGGAAQFNGPEIDINPTVRNLTLVNRVFLDNQAFPGTNLTVTGTTSITTAPGHDGEYAALFEIEGTWLLGTLTNYDAATHTLTGPFFFPIRNATIGWRGADVVTNRGTLFIGPGSQLIDQNTNQNALRNLAINEGGIEFGDGSVFTTAGDFTNDGSLSLVTSAAGMNTVFTVSGNFTNFDAGTKTLSSGYLNVEVRDSVAATSTLRFAGADIRMIENATVQIAGAGASIQDLSGQNALRNLSGINGGVVTNGGTLTITPGGGTFTTSNYGTHEISTGANITIQGNQQVTNGGMVRIDAPAANQNTVLTITGNSVIDGGTIDLGGQPGVNTQYHTELHVMNGIEFRGAYLTGTGTTFADIGMIQGSVFAPGHSPGQQTVEGAISFDSTTTLNFDIGGTSAGDGYDQLVQHGTSAVTIGGTLQLSFVNGFESTIQHSDSFDIITSEHNLAGSFVNVASGDRLQTSDGLGSFRVTYAGQHTVTLDQYEAVLGFTGAVARELHGARGAFDLPLNLTTATVEPRSSGTHHLVFSFNNNINSGDISISAPAGGSLQGSPIISGNTVSVTLAGVTDAQRVTVFLNNVTDQYGQVLGEQSIEVIFLLGDVNGDQTVNSADLTAARSRSGSPTDSTNFRADVNLDGSVNSADTTTIRSRSGNTVP